MSASILETCKLLTRWAFEYFDQTGLPLTPSRPFSYLHPFVAAQPWIGYLYKTK